MSNARSKLKSRIKELRGLYNDLSGPVTIKQKWENEVFAPLSLGDDVRVELWYLADHFLLAWHDWHSLKARFRRYFDLEGKPNAVPGSWEKLDSECLQLANQLLRDHQLEEFILEHWPATGILALEREARPTVRDVVHVVIQNHRRWLLMRNALLGVFDQTVSKAKVSVPEASIWPRCPSTVRGLNTKATELCREFQGHLGPALPYHLRHYCYSTLWVSWLDEYDKAEKSARTESEVSSSSSPVTRDEEFELGESALMWVMSKEVSMPSVDHFLSQVDDLDTRNVVNSMLERISRAIGEIGYGYFVEDVTADDFHGGLESLVGTGSITVIPGQTQEPRTSLVFAILQSAKKALQFQNIMRQVREHLIWNREAKAVVVLCDRWDPNILDENLGDLRAYHDQGVRFLFLLVGLHGRTITPVADDLGMTP